MMQWTAQKKMGRRERERESDKGAKGSGGSLGGKGGGAAHGQMHVRADNVSAAPELKLWSRHRG
eukprot:7219105-Pyramimonas_sp.AAC.1